MTGNLEINPLGFDHVSSMLITKKSLALRAARIISSHVPWKQKIIQLKLIIRRWRAISVAPNCRLSEKSMPSIEVLSVALRKDFGILPISLESIVKSSLNNIDQISVISPRNDISEFVTEDTRFEIFGTEVKFIPEELVISENSRQRLQAMFGSRYGWVLQQLLTVKFCLDSNARGVLVVNADTVLLKELQWLDKFGNQVLMPSLEFHPPYYDFLNRAFGNSKNPKFTFITHHMLIQPDKLRAIFSKLKIGDIDELITLVEKHALLTEMSAVCLEFEIYAQHLLKFFPKNVKLVKFSNISLPNRENLTSQIDMLREKVSGGLPINSISFHEYLSRKG